MADPADIGPQYQCEECGVWSPDKACIQCGAELGEDVRGVPVVHAKEVIAEGEVAPSLGGLKFFTGNVIACASSPHYDAFTGGKTTYAIDCMLTINGVDLDKLNGMALDDYARMLGGPPRRAPKKDGNQ